MSSFKKVVINKESKEKLEKFYTWVYKNEIVNDVAHINSGELVQLKDQNGGFMGIGYFNYKSEITIRVLSFQDEPINEAFFEKRIVKAIAKREHLKSKSNAYRLIHSEADLLPALIVDFYNGYLGVQFNSFGIEQYREMILKILIRHLSPIGIFDKSESKVRKIEGLETKNEVIFGEVAEIIDIVENGIKFSMSLIEGQKTGFYLDQRKNREIVGTYIKAGDDVLDVFCNAGGFGLYGLKNGANLHFVDISPNAITQVNHNITLNNFKAKVTKQDAFDFITNEVTTSNLYNVVVLDPPPFAKTKKESFGAIKGMKFLLSSGLKLLKEDGIVAIFSCSHHIGINELLDISLESSKNSAKMVEILEILRADSDHPYIVNIPNSNYLSGLVLKVQ
jgi:23S rRNA (cytosine1962-C5)-methyltransferase